VLRTDLAAYLPELRRGPGELDAPLARRVLAHLAEIGPDRFVTEWMNGGLVPLIGAPRHRPEELTDLVDELEWFRVEKTARDGYIGDLEARLADVEEYARALAARLDGLDRLDGGAGTTPEPVDACPPAAPVSPPPAPAVWHLPDLARPAARLRVLLDRLLRGSRR
jgi:hypothetical protein